MILISITHLLAFLSTPVCMRITTACTDYDCLLCFVAIRALVNLQLPVVLGKLLKVSAEQVDIVFDIARSRCLAYRVHRQLSQTDVNRSNMR